MTREAKIGMLTGLGVIVLIGTLLSEYLGGGAHPMGTSGMGATGRMAELPMGAAYRQEIMQPVGVPSLVRNDGAAVAPGAGAATPAAPVVSAAPAGQTAFGSTDVGGGRLDGQVSNGPAIQQAVTAVPAGTVAMDAPAQVPTIPTMQMPAAGVQTVYVPGQQQAAAGQARGMTVAGTVEADADAAGAVAPEKPSGQEYVIASGDNLAKIAKKFYKSSKNSDIARIVAANPGMLKNEKSMLVAGKKLLIPNAPVVVVETPVPAEPTMPAVGGAMVIRKPGSAEAGAGSKSAAAPAKKSAAKVYVVQANDTLEKIAKKVGVPAKKIASANGIKDVKSLQVGEKLKVPAV